MESGDEVSKSNSEFNNKKGGKRQAVRGPKTGGASSSVVQAGISRAEDRSIPEDLKGDVNTGIDVLDSTPQPEASDGTFKLPAEHIPVVVETSSKLVDDAEPVRTSGVVDDNSFEQEQGGGGRETLGATPLQEVSDAVSATVKEKCGVVDKSAEQDNEDEAGDDAREASPRAGKDDSPRLPAEFIEEGANQGANVGADSSGSQEKDGAAWHWSSRLDMLADCALNDGSNALVVAAPPNEGRMFVQGREAGGSSDWLRAMAQQVISSNGHRGGGKGPTGGPWLPEEDRRLLEIVQERGAGRWKEVAGALGIVRTDAQCMHRWNKVLKPGLVKGAWTAAEDKNLTDAITEIGLDNVKWGTLAAESLPGRNGKQCRERWFNHLDPNVKKSEWTAQEDSLLFEAQLFMGNRWCEIAKLLPGRTDNHVKNRYNSSARKKWLSENPKAAEGEGKMSQELSDRMANVYKNKVHVPKSEPQDDSDAEAKTMEPPSVNTPQPPAVMPVPIVNNNAPQYDEIANGENEGIGGGSQSGVIKHVQSSSGPLLRFSLWG